MLNTCKSNEGSASAEYPSGGRVSNAWEPTQERGITIGNDG
jgi:hypothetical protein